MKSPDVITTTLASNVRRINLKQRPISFFGILLMAQISMGKSNDIFIRTLNDNKIFDLKKRNCPGKCVGKALVAQNSEVHRDFQILSYVCGRWIRLSKYLVTVHQMYL